MSVETAKRCVKNSIPWRIRYQIKLLEAKGVIRLPENIKQNRGIDEYNAFFYETLTRLGIGYFVGKTVCELGPGQHLSHAFIEYIMGAEKEYLLEIADFAHVGDSITSKELDLKQFNSMEERGLPEPDKGETRESYLGKINAIYSTDGLKGYRKVPDGSVDYCFSFSVLEHVRKNIFIETVKEMYRFMKKGGVCYHTVDYKDHLGGKKNQLRFPESVWEDEIHYAMDNYTNRISCSDMCEIMKEVGFTIKSVKRRKFRKPPISRKHINDLFQDISDEDLLTADAIIITEKH